MDRSHQQTHKRVIPERKLNCTRQDSPRSLVWSHARCACRKSLFAFWSGNPLECRMPMTWENSFSAFFYGDRICSESLFFRIFRNAFLSFESCVWMNHPILLSAWSVCESVWNEGADATAGCAGRETSRGSEEVSCRLELKLERDGTHALVRLPGTK